MFYIRAYTSMYVCDTSCTYTIRSAPYVVRILHVFASIIENIRAHTADRMLIFTYAHTCIYVLSGSLMKYCPTALITLLQTAIKAFIAGHDPTVHPEEWLGALVALLPKSLAALLMTKF